MKMKPLKCFLKSNEAGANLPLFLILFVKIIFLQKPVLAAATTLHVSRRDSVSLTQPCSLHIQQKEEMRDLIFSL